MHSQIQVYKANQSGQTLNTSDKNTFLAIIYFDAQGSKDEI